MTRPAIATAGGALLLAALAGCGPASPPAPVATATPVPTATPIAVLLLGVGQCLDDAGATGSPTVLPVAPCDQPHDSEVFASAAVPAGIAAYDRPAILAAADSACTSRFADFVGVASASSALALRYLTPSADSWAQGDRGILCVVADPAGRTTGSLRGAAR